MLGSLHPPEIFDIFRSFALEGPSKVLLGRGGWGTEI